MANIFDKDTASTDNHLLNEQFHAFSKSPSSPGSTLGGASNRSGHTVSASDVWAEKIPAFFYPKADSDYAVCKANAKLNDICRWGDEIQIWDGEKFVKFADNYAAIPDGHEFLNEDGQPVVRFHKSRVAYNLNDTNNAYDNSLDASGKGASAKILGWDKTANDGAGGVYAYVESAPQFITQFVAPTDNIVKGVPSKGYGPIVMVGGSPLTEDADSTAGYIANNFAGIIQFNERKKQGDVTVHAFEYCGKTLGTTVSDIAELDEKISKISVTAAGGVQALSDAAKAAGFEIDAVVSDGVTTPTLDLTTATITDGIFASTTGNKAKLVTAADVESYVAKNAKVSVNGQSATTITVKGTEASAADLVKVVVTEDKTTTDKIGLTFTATLDKAVLNDDGSIKENGVVIATIAQEIAETVADTAITNAITTDNGAIKDAISDAIEDATLATADNAIQTAEGDNASKLVTAEQVKEYVTENAQVTVTVGSTKKTSTGFEFAGSTGTDIAVAPTMDANGKVTYSATLSKATVNASTGAITNGGLAVSATDAKTIADKAISASLAGTTDGTIGKAISDVEAIATGVSQSVAGIVSDAISDATSKTGIVDNDTSTKLVTAAQVATYVASEIPSVTTTSAAGTVGVTANGHTIDVTTADYTAATETGKIGTWTDATKGYLVTGATVAAAIGDVNAKVDALHKTPQFKVVVVDGVTDLTKWQDSVTGGLQENHIYLVENIDAADGSYIEYIAYKNGETLVTERIGTTKTDLSGYAKSVKINNGTAITPDATTGEIDLGNVVTNAAWDNAAADHPGNAGASTYATLSNGTLTLGIASATSTTKGLSKLFTGNYWELSSDVTDTAVSTLTASKMFDNIGDKLDDKADANNVVNYIEVGSTALSSISNTECRGALRLNGGFYNELAGLAVTTPEWSTTGIRVETGLISSAKYSSNYRTLHDVKLFEACTKVEGNVAACAATDTQHIMFEITPEKFIDSFNARDAKGLTTWTSDMPNLKANRTDSSDNGMFEGCTALESFCGDLSSMTDGGRMFYLCTALTSFCGDLSSLTEGDRMFGGCTLDAESLECIAETLPTITTNAIIDVGNTTNLSEEVITTIRGKGWNIYSNINPIQ